MNRLSLDWVSASGEAVFAIDRTDRIILWNQASEALLGHPAASVLGQRCFTVLGGRDVHGNVHCYANCPVVYQLRRLANEPIQRFSMRVRTAAGGTKIVSSSAFLLDGENPRFSVIAHVLKEDGDPISELELSLQRLAATTSRAPKRFLEQTLEDLTAREREILRCLTRGMSTATIADELCIAQVTVRNHVRSVLQKLGVHTRFAAVAYAYQNDIV